MKEPADLWLVKRRGAVLIVCSRQSADVPVNTLALLFNWHSIIKEA